jgi:hypothetical protein
MTTDNHQLHADHLPTSFTADETAAIAGAGMM